MKVSEAQSPTVKKFERKSDKPRPDREAILKKLADRNKPKKPEAEKQVEISKKAKNKAENEAKNADKKGVKNSTEEGFGDIGDNDPSSPETKEKLKHLLKSGAFNFDPRERKVLSEILKD